MNMRLWLLFFFFMGYAGAQDTPSLTGFVVDGLGQPIPYSTVECQDQNGTVITHGVANDKGQFSLLIPTNGVFALIGHSKGYTDGTAIITLPLTDSKPLSIVLTSQQALELTLDTTRLDTSRTGISTATGGSVTHFDQQAIQDLPEGEHTPFNEILLQAPGVVNDSFGQIHVRGEHANLQYRVNGVLLPDSISGFGQYFTPQFATQVDLLTGALPAMYGFRTAGVVDIKTQQQFNGTGQFDLFGGTQNTFNPSVSYGNTVGDVSYFVTGSSLSNNIGIAPPTPGNQPLHDNTQQYQGFGYMSWLINPSTKMTLMTGAYQGNFQMPNSPNQVPDPNHIGIMTQLGLNGYNSSTVNDQESENNRFVMMALQGSFNEETDYQTTLFNRYSDIQYTPDVLGNLVFNGAASAILRSSTSTGSQTDITFHHFTNHTISMGFYGNVENIVSNNTSTVFPVNPATGMVSGSPYAITNNISKNGNYFVGVYGQDEWSITQKLTLNYGARFDKVDAFVNESQLSPRLGMVYSATPQTTLHIGYSRYFTPPPTELVSTQTLQLFQNTTLASSGQNSPVYSERADYYDAGVLQKLSSHWTMGFDTFYKQSTNTLDEGQFGPSLIMTPFNYNQGLIYGAEFTTSYTNDNLSAYANLARTRSQAKGISSSQYLFTPAELNYAANNWVYVDHQQSFTASAGAAWTVGTMHTHLTTDYTYQSGLRNGFDNTTSLPGYSIVNFGISQPLQLASTGPLEVRLVLINAFNGTYLIRDGTGIGVFAPQYGVPRELMLGVTIPLGPKPTTTQ
ncbi:MAG: TonB-dependent receptor [Ferrovum sp.]|nr:TonB-dependent receptor [Ferrovum sp.]